MNLLTLLMPTPAQPPSETQQPKPKRRGRWVRKPSKRERQEREVALTAEVRQKLAAWGREQAQAQDDLLAKSVDLPDGIRIVGQECSES